MFNSIGAIGNNYIDRWLSSRRLLLTIHPLKYGKTRSIYDNCYIGNLISNSIH